MRRDGLRGPRESGSLEPSDFDAFFETSMRPQIHGAGAEILASLVTEPASSNSGFRSAIASPYSSGLPDFLTSRRSGASQPGWLGRAAGVMPPRKRFCRRSCENLKCCGYCRPAARRSSEARCLLGDDIGGQTPC